MKESFLPVNKNLPHENPFSAKKILLWSFCFGSFLIIFLSGFEFLFKEWTREEYSHGFVIPFLSLFLIWQKKEQLKAVSFSGSWLGFSVFSFGVAVYFLGELSTLRVLVHYAFLLMLWGLVYSYVGKKAFVIMLVPLFYLFFMVPLPNFIYHNLSSELQLISSEIGVAIIRLFGIMVFLEGNVIDLGSFKLQVVEACSGLRYLFPLTSFAFICAYMFRTAMWMRVLVFLSSIPITVLMNSVRVGVIGVLVEHWGIGAAEGFLHDFEGWVVFMLCVATLMVEMWLLHKLSKDTRPFSAVFVLFESTKSHATPVIRHDRMSKPFIASLLVLGITVIGSLFVTNRDELLPERTNFNSFPMQIEEWQGQPQKFTPSILEGLKLTDYVIADYKQDNTQVVNFYSAYYQSQRGGEAAHSPRSCIPGGGWEIVGSNLQVLDDVSVNGLPLKVKRMQIQKGEHKQLVYYWFRQRDRLITNEFLVKWYLFWDALTKNRTDGALLRLTTAVPSNQDWASGDARLAKFAKLVIPRLDGYLPD